jgi:hypothetical protein
MTVRSALHSWRYESVETASDGCRLSPSRVLPTVGCSTSTTALAEVVAVTRRS